jgi:hypothetical protein
VPVYRLLPQQNITELCDEWVSAVVLLCAQFHVSGWRLIAQLLLPLLRVACAGLKQTWDEGASCKL